MRRLSSPCSVFDFLTGEANVFFPDKDVVYDEVYEEMEDNYWMLNEAYMGILVPKSSKMLRIDLVPTSILFVKTIYNKEYQRLLHCLFDLGALHTLINSSLLPKHVTTFALPEKERTQTIAGTYNSSKTVRLCDIYLPEFDKMKKQYGVTAHILDAQCNYDIILG